MGERAAIVKRDIANTEANKYFGSSNLSYYKVRNFLFLPYKLQLVNQLQIPDNLQEKIESSC